MPRPGDSQLRIISSNLVEVFMVTSKDADPAILNTWNFIDANGSGSLPAASQFAVSANGQSLPISTVGFKRRVLYAPLRTRDLRIANWLYLKLSTAIPTDAVVNVQNTDGTLWSGSTAFTATNSVLRYSPAIHVNQAGYVLNFSKKAMVGYYLGSLGELPIPTNSGFQIVNASSGATVFNGSLTRRPDVGYTYTPTPYQQVFEADFTSFNTPGEYKVVVPAFGASFPVTINEGMAATYARTYALGIYHQRCGTDNVMPYTRFTHGPCHTNLVLVPSAPGPEQTFVNFVLNQESAGALSNPRHTAPRMVSVDASLYPFVNTGLIDARGGHHDAGDYSKYTTSVAAFVHYLTFAVDALPGVKDLDNMGLPESGDGISDIIQEAKWEADYLAKLQDADGGFYFIVYPRTRQYELDVLPDHGDLQLVLPKNTAATAAAVAALAEIASSPTFKAAYPVAAADYLSKALKGWQFLQNAIAAHGRDGAYQMITFSGDVFMHDDELAWAAAALYAATGDPTYDAELRSQVPDPNSQDLRRWSWWSMFGGYGCAFRTYAFAARSGRLAPNQLNATYVAKCENEIRRAATNVIKWSDQSAYGTSFVEESKSSRLAGWYFSGEWTFDAAAAYALDARQQYLDVILKDYNYEMGCNPVNITYLTGLGWKRQREIVHQYALNDNHVLPLNGIPLGNIQASYDYLQLYKSELGNLSYPSDSASSATYPYYDRWADTFNVSTEFVVSQTAKTLPAAAMLMAMTPTKTVPSAAVTGQITGIPAQVSMDTPVTAQLTAAGYDLSKARITWEGLDQEPYIGPQFKFTPGNLGTNWIEAEAQMPDGQRILARTTFFAIPAGEVPRTQTIQPEMVALYHLEGDFTDATGRNPNLVPQASANLDPVALRVNGLGDRVQVAIPNAALVTQGKTKAISVEARVFVTAYKAYGTATATILALTKSWDNQMYVQQDKWKVYPDVKASDQLILDGAVLTNALTLRQWHQLSVTLDENNYVVRVDGNEVGRKPTGQLATWSGNGDVALQLGEFDGWISEVVLWNLTNSAAVTPPPDTNAPPPGTWTNSSSTSMTVMSKNNEGYYRFRAQTPLGNSYVLNGSTDLKNWIPLYTNFLGGLIEYIDTRSLELPRRFYHLQDIGTNHSALIPGLSVVTPPAADRFRVHINSPGPEPYVVQASTDLVNWIDVYTNYFGVSADLGMDTLSGSLNTFYRTAPANLKAKVTVEPDSYSGVVWLYSEGPPGIPYVIQYTTNSVDWNSLSTNSAGGSLWSIDWDWNGSSQPLRTYRVSSLSFQPRVTKPVPFGVGYYYLQMETVAAQPYELQASSNLNNWSGILTNPSGGWLDFIDYEAQAYSRRFYRLRLLPVQADITWPRWDTSFVQLHLDGLPATPYVIETSTDQVNWTLLTANPVGGTLDFVDTQDITTPRYYRLSYQMGTIRGTK